MDTSYIKIIVKPFEHDYDKSFVFGIPIDGGLLRDIMEPIHEEDLDLTLFRSGIELNKVALERKTKIRENRAFWSKKLSNLITEKILEMLESNDTIDGYLKKDR